MGNLTPPFLCPTQAFTVIDQNRDGIIDKEDLRDTFAAMGEPPT